MDMPAKIGTGLSLQSVTPGSSGTEHPVRHIRTVDDLSDLMGSDYQESQSPGENLGRALRAGLFNQNVSDPVCFHDFDICTALYKGEIFLEIITAPPHIQFVNCRLLDGILHYHHDEVTAVVQATALKIDLTQVMEKSSGNDNANNFRMGKESALVLKPLPLFDKGTNADLKLALKNAFQFWVKGDINLARARYNEILVNDPENKEASYFLGLLQKNVACPMKYFATLHQLSTLPLTVWGEGCLANRGGYIMPLTIYEPRPWDHTEEAYTIGLMFLEGSGLPQSDEQAARFLLISGRKGSLKLEEMYLQGRCITKDTRPEVIEYLSLLLFTDRAANRPLIKLILGKLYIECDSLSNAILHLIDAVKARQPGALDELVKAISLCSPSEKRILKRQYVQNSLIRKVTDKRYSEATLGFTGTISGHEVQPGKTIPATYSIALKNMLYHQRNGAHEIAKALYEEMCRNAEEGDADANHTLGIMYLEGIGIESDEEKATTYLLASKDKGQSKLEEMYRRGRCITEESRDQALTYLKHALSSDNNLSASDLILTW